MRQHYTCALTLLTISGAIFAGVEQGSALPMEVDSGVASFESTTNMPGIEVKGKSNALTGRVEVNQEPTGLVLKKIDASVAVKSLATGMKVRDEHMRKYIFTTADGQTPDVRFEASTAACPAPATAREFTCKLTGTMTIRGASHPLELTLQAKQQQGTNLAFRVAGDGIVKLSDFGITAPSQFGVTPANEVKFHLDFVARQKSSVAGNAGGR